jgi:hypothetical protein
MQHNRFLASVQEKKTKELWDNDEDEAWKNG